MNETAFRQLVSGKVKGAGPALLRTALRAASCPYGWAVSVRNRLYDRGQLASYSVPCTVVSIGNLTTGGTGKTPLVIWLANQLLAKGRSCVILTRGYRTAPDRFSDEPALLAKACGGAEVLVNPDRVQAARKAVEKYHPDILLLDDGFQHRRLNRDLDILAVDASCPFGYGRLLPAGLLREPVSSVRRAHIAVITRFDLATEEQIADIEQTLRRFQPNLAIFHAVHKQRQARTFQGRSIPVEQLAGKKTFVFCGIGNPTAFLRSLESLGIIVSGRFLFEDHHPYTPDDMDVILRQARKSNADAILTTEKDWVKTALLVGQEELIPFYYLPVELEFLTDPEPIVRAVLRQIEAKYQEQK
ncbi:MAG TPA: tetraacyldisaccharide 4'-kinase [Anaerohalosphaeraceae bacterium]|nr:tetraacyldisaccharide 4'-kinase [Anaerohalosphaeraceae bacterium]